MIGRINATKPRLVTDDSGNTELSLTVCPESKFSVKQLVKTMKDSGKDEFTVTVDTKKNPRSLDANAYCWTLIGKLSEKTRIPPGEIYRTLIKDVGGNYDVVCVQQAAVESLERHWCNKGLGWQTERLDSKLDGCVNVVLYYGSSEYDTKQMSRLISLVVDECKEQDIETKTPDELAKLVSLWG